MMYNDYKSKYNDMIEVLEVLKTNGIFNEVYDYTIRIIQDILLDIFLEYEIDFDKAHQFIYDYIDDNDLCKDLDYIIDYYHELYD